MDDHKVRGVLHPVGGGDGGGGPARKGDIRGAAAACVLAALSARILVAERGLRRPPQRPTAPFLPLLRCHSVGVRSRSIYNGRRFSQKLGTLCNSIRGKRERRRAGLLYWDLADYLSVMIIVLYVVGLYAAYSLTRIARGAPAAWYVIIMALALLLLRRVVELYYDVQTNVPLFNNAETALSFFVALFLSAGLVMLTRGFRRQLRASQDQTRF
jgi:hypothetical protein